MEQYELVNHVTLSDSIFKQRYEVERHYLFGLKNENLLQNYLIEAGFKSFYAKPEQIHWGWESPECQLRGHYLGHWLSAAAKMVAQTNDLALKVKADQIVDELEACQIENGGKWVGSIPEKYLNWIAKGRYVWAPQYTLHKTLMGLIDMYKFTGNDKALRIADKFSDWFYEWTTSFDREQMDNILDFETGGLLEAWADLLDITKNHKYEVLIERYYRSRLFERLLTKEDCLTDKHANTTIPEILGLARLYEVTNDKKYKAIAMEYFKQAVDDRGYFSTGGQTNGESWTPPHELGARLGNANQEHCVVYNMIRLADYLLKWTGEKQYADYIERNIYNGLFAQQNIETGTALYYLSLLPNSKKDWGTLEEDFWCCYGTVAQAPTLYTELAYYKKQSELMISQFIPSTYEGKFNESTVTVEQKFSVNRTSLLNPLTDQLHVNVTAKEPTKFTLKVRIPWWTKEIEVKFNNEVLSIEEISEAGYLVLTRVWETDELCITYKKEVYVEVAPDMPYLTSFMYGPSVLAGLSNEKTLSLQNGEELSELLRPINVNRWANAMFYAKHASNSIRFIPISDVLNENYTVYFPVIKE